VDLDIAPQRITVDHDACIEKVRTSACVVLPLISDTQCLSTHRLKLSVQMQAIPDMMQKLLIHS